MRNRHRLAVALTGFLLMLVLAACGNKAPQSGTATVTPSPTTTLSPTQQWTTKVCGAITTWEGQINRAVGDITMAVSGEVKLTQVPTAIRDALGQAASASRQLAGDLTAAGMPQTQQGSQIEAELTGLATRVTQSVDSIRNGVQNLPTDSLAALATSIGDINSQLKSLVADVESTFARVSALDPKGELAAAIASTPSCKPLMPAGAAGGSSAPMTATASPATSAPAAGVGGGAATSAR